MKKILEELKLYDPADETTQMGDYYTAESKEDVFKAVDSITLGDSVGFAIKQLDEIGEITIELVDEDAYNILYDQDSELAQNDFERKYTQSAENISKEELIHTLNSMFQDAEVISIEAKNKELYRESFYNVETGELQDTMPDYYNNGLSEKDFEETLNRLFIGSQYYYSDLEEYKEKGLLPKFIEYAKNNGFTAAQLKLHMIEPKEQEMSFDELKEEYEKLTDLVDEESTVSDIILARTNHIDDSIERIVEKFPQVKETYEYEDIRNQISGLYQIVE